MMCLPRLICLLVVLIPLLDCAQSEDMKSMQVTATAYTMDEAETKKGHVGLAAWGDQLEPGMKVIAVSRDLIAKGLDHNTKVRIEGLDGTYVVRDKMNKRWKKKIDIFMGNDRQKALKWGKRKVRIYWRSSSQDNE
ncbi:MAG: 3D domain-containing protein [Desulfovermiculus sp.]|nr:3D domain-containing protein [Desulfovermiculus sp.]